MECPKCGKYLTALESHSEKNPGRWYFTHNHCKFFKWTEVPKEKELSGKKRKQNFDACASLFPKEKKEKPRIFFAGAVGHHTDHYCINYDDIPVNTTREEFIKEMVDCEAERETCIKTGCFSFYCRHDCFTGEWRTAEHNHDPLEDKDDDGLGGNDVTSRFQRDIIPEACYAQIKKSNYVYAIISKAEQYGTVVEIVFACMNGIPVFIRFENISDNEIKEYWFLLNLIKKTILKCEKICPTSLHDSIFQTVTPLKYWNNVAEYVE